MTKLYEYTVIFEGNFESVVFNATDAGEAYNEVMHKDTLCGCPEGTLIISIVRGAERPYRTDMKG